MQTDELTSLTAFSCAVEGETHEIKSIYCADLLSWAMSRAPEGSVWCTVMGNVNMVAVATLAEVAAVVLCEGALLDESAKLRAKQEGLCVFTSTLPAFEAGVAIAKHSGILT